MRARRYTMSILALGVVAVLLTACSCSKDADPDAAPGSSAGTSAAVAPTSTVPAVPTFPLRGTAIDDPARAQRPALIVKIDNIDGQARPQAGINSADIVFEEKIEGPISRFAAIFHALDVPDIGPVRSGRSTDVAIVSALNHPLYAFSGANGRFLAELRAAPLIDIGYDIQPASYDRRPDRKAPDNVFTSSARLWALGPPEGPPPAQFRYRTTTDPLPAGALAVTTFGYDFGPGPIGQPVTFTWDAAAGGWARTQKGTPHVDAAGAVITPANVIVQFTPYHETGMYDLSGAPVPEAELVGAGDAWVFIQGHAVKATWSKPDAGAVTVYTASDGTPVAVDPGQTWIALVEGPGYFQGTATDGTDLG